MQQIFGWTQSFRHRALNIGSPMDRTEKLSPTTSIAASALASVLLNGACPSHSYPQESYGADSFLASLLDARMLPAKRRHFEDGSSFPQAGSQQGPNPETAHCFRKRPGTPSNHHVLSMFVRPWQTPLWMIDSSRPVTDLDDPMRLRELGSSPTRTSCCELPLDLTRRQSHLAAGVAAGEEAGILDLSTRKRTETTTIPTATITSIYRGGGSKTNRPVQLYDVEPGSVAALPKRSKY